MRFFSTSLLLLAGAAACASAATKEYPACTPQRAQQYFSSLSNEISQCQTTSTYDLTSSSLPTTTQRAAVCKCTALIKQLPNVRVPRCKISLDGNQYKFKDAVESVFADCDGVRVLEEPLPASQAGSKAADETGADADVSQAPTSKPTTKPTATPPAKNNSTSSGSSAGSSGASAGSIETPKPREETQAPKTTKPPATSAVPTATPTPTPKSDAVTTATTALMTVVVATAATVLL